MPMPTIGSCQSTKFVLCFRFVVLQIGDRGQALESLGELNLARLVVGRLRDDGLQIGQRRFWHESRPRRGRANDARQFARLDSADGLLAVGVYIRVAPPRRSLPPSRDDWSANISTGPQPRPHRVHPSGAHDSGAARRAKRRIVLRTKATSVEKRIADPGPVIRPITRSTGTSPARGDILPPDRVGLSISARRGQAPDMAENHARSARRLPPALAGGWQHQPDPIRLASRRAGSEQDGKRSRSAGLAPVDGTIGRLTRRRCENASPPDLPRWKARLVSPNPFFILSITRSAGTSPARGDILPRDRLSLSISARRERAPDVAENHARSGLRLPPVSTGENAAAPVVFEPALAGLGRLPPTSVGGESPTSASLVFQPALAGFSYLALAG